MISTVRIGPAPVLAVDVVEGRGAPVLMLHGVGGRRSNWRAQLAALEAAGRRAAAWDARGYGDSEDYEGPLAMAHFVDDVVRVLDHLVAERAHLVGLSMGGRIALATYAAHPERVASLVLADTSAGHPSSRDPTEVERALELRVRPLLEGRSPAETAPAMARHMAGDAATPQVLAEMVESLSAVHPESYVKTMRCLTQETDFTAFEAITVPVLAINGAQDPIARVAVAERLAANIPDHVFVRLEGVGHLSNLEAPDAFNAALLAFLDRVDSRTGGRP